MIFPRLTHFMDSFTDIVRVATSRLKSANLYLATVQKMGGTSFCPSLKPQSFTMT